MHTARIASASRGVSHPCNEAERNGKGVAQRRSTQAKHGRLGKELVGARGGARRESEELLRNAIQRLPFIFRDTLELQHARESIRAVRSQRNSASQYQR